MSVLIGRRELFAFAERYSSCRLRDYADLADGVVLCSLFNLVFPELRIRTASPQTHTLSQRTQMNWAALRSALDDVGIPLNLLDQGAIQHGDAEKGFSALVLFYFLYHLTKRTDFSAEFATDVSELLTEFLQSIDSIAALVVGGALPLTAVPPQLQESLRIATVARRRRPAPGRAQRREGSLAVSSLGVSEEDNEEWLKRQLSFDTEAMTVSSQLLEDEVRGPVHVSNEALAGRRCTGQISHQGKRKQRTDKESTVIREIAEKARSCSTSSRSSHTARGERGVMGPSVVEREVELQQALIAMSEECEKLKVQRTELLAQLTKLRAEASANSSLPMSEENDASKQKLEEEQRRVAMLEEELIHLRRILQRTREERCSQTPASASFVEELLKDVVDTETGEVVNVHETATSLHSVILDALRDSPRRRHDAQRWLWLIVSAYHVIETRLVTACDLAAMEWRRLEGSGSDGNSYSQSSSCNWVSEATAELQSTPNTTAKKMHFFQTAPPASFSPDVAASATNVAVSKLAAEMERRQKQFEHQLSELHTTEKNLRQRVHQLETHLRRFATKAIEREVKWKSLCAAIHEAERISFGIAESETTEEVEQLLTRRQSWYARAEKESAFLMQKDAADTFDTASESTAGGHDVCEAMRTLVLSVTQDRDRLQREITELRKVFKAPVQLPQASARTNALKDAIQNRLLEQKEYEQDEVWFVRADSRPPYTLSSPSTKRVSVTPAKMRGVGEHDAATPFARNLSALLASVTPV
ncbi:62 kDa protein Tc-1 [Trypanosoma rangeli]|uniref:62 kDa protein Tc-1 n=1 Tax=Trypanosoma rangeli TaxID=5698 RepID=A0A3R7MF74_TRYRA|nr:62 kDa protein Tc-1 [Trypanosoma rangeli]RNF01419.1 62 kDa protein Tc-1 [Trypanosoma rangeli]|eukprot:RNF01419.1 62 kDa protein Tc-1 [Trypanosoma rangeli]